MKNQGFLHFLSGLFTFFSFKIVSKVAFVFFLLTTGLIYVLHRKFVLENGQNVLQCKTCKTLTYELNSNIIESI